MSDSFPAARARYQVGRAQPDEVPLLPDIERRAGDLFLGVPAVAALPLYLTPLEDFEVAQRAGLLWTARLDDRPVGFALVEALGDGIHLEEIDVLPEHGRRGLGRALVERVRRYAEEGRQTLSLCTFKDVPWNAPFYARMGFHALPSAEVWPLLARKIAEETARGLPPELRVAMCYRAPAPGPGRDSTA